MTRQCLDVKLPPVTHFAAAAAAAGLTLVAVSASEALLALAAELAAGLAAAAAVRSAHVGRDVALSSGRAVGRHRHGAAVDHCVRDRDGVRVRLADVLEPPV